MRVCECRQGQAFLRCNIQSIGVVLHPSKWHLCLIWMHSLAQNQTESLHAHNVVLNKVYTLEAQSLASTVVLKRKYASNRAACTNFLHEPPDMPTRSHSFSLNGCAVEGLCTAAHIPPQWKAELTYLIVNHHDRDHDSLGRDAVLQELKVDQAILFDWQISDFEAPVLQIAAAVQHTLVVRLQCDDVVLLLLVEVCNSLDG